MNSCLYTTTLPEQVGRIPRVSEPARGRKQPGVPERHVVRMWLDAASPERVFRTTDTAELRVLYPGVENLHDGPDFLSAEIILNGRLLRGDIELHTHADDWWRHGHDADSGYDRVILHVALYAPTRRGSLPATVLLPGQLDASLRDAWSAVLPSRHAMACSAANAVEHHPDADIMLMLMALRRYHRKCERMRQRFEDLAHLHASETALRQVVWEAVARAAGYGGNQDRMERAARSLTLSGILALPASLRAGQLSSAAGHAEAMHPGEVIRRTWLSGAITPSNRANPRLRWLAGWAELLQEERWWEALRQAASAFRGDAAVFVPLFRIDGEQGSPGPDRIGEIATNVLAPLLLLMSGLHANTALARCSRAVYFTTYPAAANRVTRIVSPVLNIPSRCSSLQQQGMIELFTEFCSTSRCGYCLLSSGY